jgi:lipooligosaccharide transport system ATP-binding protein
MDKIAIHVKNVSKYYGELQAVNNLSFDVEETTCFGLLGPNGAGKTTMMKLIYGKAFRDKNTDSSINVFNLDPVRDELAIKTFSGVVPQEDNLDEELNVIQNLIVYSRFYAIPRKIANARIDGLLNFMELSDKIKAKVSELSGGMKRRLIIARALINNPKLLILDEPTTGLDPQVRQLIWDKLRKLRKEGVTILITTHYMEEAFEICDRIIIMNKGEKIVEGNPRELVEKNIEKYALQVHNHDQIECLRSYMNEKIIRKEESEEMAIFYSNDMPYLEKMTECLQKGDFYIRQTNLEDLFLKATGRGLSDEQ